MVGRPRSFDRDAALAVATETFWRNGYEETSISTLVGAIGIAPPSLYAAFGDKSSLFHEAAAVYIANLREQVETCLAEPSARGAIQRLLVTAARAHTDPATPPGCLVYSEPRLARERAWVLERVAERLYEAQEAGDLADDSDPPALAGLVETVLIGMSERARRGAGADELVAVARLAALSVPRRRAAESPAETSAPSPARNPAMLRGHCACEAVACEVADEFLVAYNCHCSRCRAMTGSAFLPWGEIEPEKLLVSKGKDSLLIKGDPDGHHATRCRECFSLLYWSGYENKIRVPYGLLIDAPSLTPMAHMFVGSKASWYEIRDDLPQHNEYPWPDD